MAAATSSYATTSQIPFTPEESSWLAAHPVIRVGFDPDWPPFSFRGPDGQLKGADPELLNWMSQALGVRFEIFTGPSWEDVFQRLREGDLDMTASTALTESRANFLQFTQPYFPFPVVIITRQDSPFLLGMEQLRSRLIAVPRLHVTTEHLQKRFPEFRLLLTTHSAEALRLVAEGQADATVAHLAHASHLIRELDLDNLKISGLTDMRFDLRYAVRQDWPELVAILNKALDAMPPEVKADILGRWIQLDPPGGIRWKHVRPYAYAVAAAALMVGFILILINRLQAKEITRRRQAEADLRRAHQQMTALSEEKSNLMQMVAHDLRGPLTGILLASELLEDDLQTNPHLAASHLEDIRASAARMRRLTEQLDAVDALESGRQSVVTEPTDLRSIVQQTVEAHQSKARSKNIQLRLLGDPNPAMAQADPDALERVLDNLISNALKFTPPGGFVELKLEPSGQGYTLTIRDSGPGFTPADRKNLFKKFARLSARPTAGESSTGLGLTVVKALMDAQGASVSLAEAEGGGAEFRLHFVAA